MEQHYERAQILSAVGGCTNGKLEENEKVVLYFFQFFSAIIACTLRISFQKGGKLRGVALRMDFFPILNVKLKISFPEFA